MAEPILPQNLSNPTMTGQIQRRAQGEINRAVSGIKREVLRIFDSVPRQRIDADTGQVVNSSMPDDHWFYVNRNIVYRYELSAKLLSQLSSQIDDVLNLFYIGTESGNALSDWFMYASVNSAYEQGTAAAVTNLAAISPEYTRSLIDVITSPAYLNRIALLRTRVFENMKGLTDQTRSDLADTLARGMQAGQNPRDISKTIRERIDVSKSRAERIARTEINNSHRRARWDEHRDAETRLGIRTRLMHISALLPTTRRTHADRNGNVYTVQEVEDWYAVDANSINCRCSQVSVLVDEEGQPLNKKLQQRLQEKGDRFYAAMTKNG